MVVELPEVKMWGKGWVSGKEQVGEEHHYITLWEIKVTTSKDGEGFFNDIQGKAIKHFQIICTVPPGTNNELLN